MISSCWLNFLTTVLIVKQVNCLHYLFYSIHVPSIELSTSNLLSTRLRWWWGLGRLINRGVRAFLNKHYEEVKWLTIWMFIFMFSRYVNIHRKFLDYSPWWNINYTSLMARFILSLQMHNNCKWLFLQLNPI